MNPRPPDPPLKGKRHRRRRHRHRRPVPTPTPKPSEGGPYMWNPITRGVKIGEHFDAPTIPQSTIPPVTIAVYDTTGGLFTAKQLADLVWAERYFQLYEYNRSPWVYRGYAPPVADVILVPSLQDVPAHAWPCDLAATSDQPGALGYHADQQHISKSGPSGVHSARAAIVHPATGTEVPIMYTFVLTSREDGVAPSEVVCHEINEAIVDPWVEDESRIRKYLNKSTHEWWIGEVGDPTQGWGYDVGAPEGRPCGVPEATVASIAYPALWGLAQSRQATHTGADSAMVWTHAKAPHPNLSPWTLAPEGYMSVAPEAEPSNWSQIYGSNRPAAEKASDAYERRGEIG